MKPAESGMIADLRRRMRDAASRQSRSKALLAAALDAWGHGVRRWNETHDSYPAAFNKLAHVMDDIQRHLDAPNTRIADTGGAKPEGRT